MHSKSNCSSSRFLRGVVAAAAVALLAACGSDSTGPRNANVAGTYTLNTVNGASLPYTVPNTGDNVEIVQAATITLNGDSTYAVNATGTLNGSAGTLVTDAGSYSVAGTQVTFTSTAIPGAHYTAVASGTGTSTTLTTMIAGAFVGSSDLSFTLVLNRTS
jgi:hypothetical protein